jgi:hypothetical protein
MHQFLIVYERAAGRIVRLQEFDEAERDDALAQMFRYEREHLGNPDIEIALLGAESLDVIKRTHGRYFKSLEEVISDIQALSRGVRRGVG